MTSVDRSAARPATEPAPTGSVPTAPVPAGPGAGAAPATAAGSGPTPAAGWHLDGPAAAGPPIVHGGHLDRDPETGAPPAGGHPPVGAWPAGAVPAAGPDRFTRLVLRMHERAPGWAVPLAALGCVAAGIGYALLSDPTRSAPDAAPSCLLKLTTGLDCPGCGGTRALWYVLNGDLPAAARHHFLFVFALPFLAYLYVAWAADRSFGWKLPQLRLSSKVLGAFLVAWLVFSVARNLPWAPFTSLYV